MKPTGPDLGQLPGYSDESAQGSGPRGLFILIVNADGDVDRRMTTLLRHCRHRVQIISGGPAGLRLTRIATPDVVLLSGGLDSGDRKEIVEWLTDRAIHKRPFFIALADDAAPGNQGDPEGLPIDLFLDRPLNVRMLKRVLNRLQAILRPEARVWSRDAGDVVFQR